jgi:hypothetical protein
MYGENRIFVPVFSFPVHPVMQCRHPPAGRAVKTGITVPPIIWRMYYILRSGNTEGGRVS